MRLAGEDDNQWSTGAVHESHQALRIGQNQAGSLVGREAACKTKHQRPFRRDVRVQSAQAFVSRHGVHPLEQARALGRPGGPQPTLVHVAQALPVGRHVWQDPPVRPKLFVEQGAHLGTDPRRGVDAVGNRFHLGSRRSVAKGQAHAAPHLLAHRAVQLADAIAAGRAAQSQHGH